jgi:outer membrane protein OmpA-like peptidoglycan-associated protein
VRRSGWKLVTPQYGEIAVHPSSDAPADPAARPIPASRVAHEFGASVGDASARSLLLEMDEALGGRAPRPPKESDLAAAKDRVTAAFARGDLVAYETMRLHEYSSLLGDQEPPSGKTLVSASPTPDADKTWFSLKVVDEVGDAIDGIDIAYSVNGQRKVVQTSGAGIARLDGAEGGFANVAITNVASVREKLKPRWKEPRDPKIADDPHQTVRGLRDAIDPLLIPSATPWTLVITPYFRCTEIPGAHFAFGRSFLLRDGIEPLSGIAEDLAGDDLRKAMIFGHTDKAGPVLLNKELSERRAKALFALFTQDAGAWEELWMGSKDKTGDGHWREKWGPYESKHMLNSLGVTDRDGRALDENDYLNQPYGQALSKFQVGDYPDKPDEQAPLPSSGKLDKATRKELFLAYAKLVSRKPVDKAKLSKVGSAPYMGCGLFNPLSITAKDAQSRRVVVFVYDAAAEPRNLPCKLGDLGPCNSNCGPAPTAPDKDGKPPYRCSVYKKIAASCPCNGGADLSHDLVVRIPFPLDVVDGFKHVLVVTSDDGTIERRATLKSDARAVTDDEVEVYFKDLPPAHSYRMRAEGVDPPYEVFAFTEFSKLSNLSLDVPDGPAGDEAPALALNDAPPDDPEAVAEDAADESGEGAQA